ncbi:tetratricopeptide repeat protein 38-like [Dendronephthya gigantea]|uniref:tetratricopeptide repeat protein 38-like n=1 Tax=Dendronephthya gigantea TaxID=151771 RepID=UPI00106923E2|nr:tetratricopeptide repeat protein 38-like [Dendronephthya gigantea]
MTGCIVTEHEWRDIKGWEDYGISLSTSSNEAAKMLDALMTQLYRWGEDESLGGIPGTVKRMKEADPDYVLGALFESRFQLSKSEESPELCASLKEMERLIETQPVNEWEKKLAGVISSGYSHKALRTLEEMVIDNPKDILSLRLAYLYALTLGDWSGFKTMMPKVVDTWTPDMPFYGYVLGMHGFFLNESKQPKEAEKFTRKALSIDPCDTWSTHATSHILLETNRAEEGVKFLETSQEKWTLGTFLIVHNYWHWALFHLDKGDYESVLTILDDHIISRCTSGSNFPLSDAASLLYRLEMEGVPVGKRWESVQSLWLPGKYEGAFDDAHKMMSYLGAKDYESANSLMESCEEFVRSGKGTSWEVAKDVGVPLCEAILDYDKAKYDDVIELLLPIRDNVIRVGGSNAQRDVFDLLLIHAAIQTAGTGSKHKTLARKLIQERKQWYGESGVSERLEELLSKRNQAK